MQREKDQVVDYATLQQQLLDSFKNTEALKAVNEVENKSNPQVETIVNQPANDTVAESVPNHPAFAKEFVGNNANLAFKTPNFGNITVPDGLELPLPPQLTPQSQPQPVQQPQQQVPNSVTKQMEVYQVQGIIDAILKPNKELDEKYNGQYLETVAQIVAQSEAYKQRVSLARAFENFLKDGYLIAKEVSVQ